MNTLDFHDGFWLGGDVSKRSLDLAVAPVGAGLDDWSRLPHKHFALDAQGLEELRVWVDAWLAKGECLGLCVESTGPYSAQALERIAGLSLPEASIVNPSLPRSFGKSIGLRDKSDKVDAAVLALYGLMKRPRPNARKAPEYQRLRELWRLHEDYLKDIRAWKNRLEQHTHGDIAQRIQCTVEELEKQRAAVYMQIEEHVKNIDELRRDTELMTGIPGVGKKNGLSHPGRIRGSAPMEP